MRNFFYIVIVLSLSFSALGEKKTIDQLREEAEKSSGGHQAELYAELANRLVDVANEQFNAGDSVKGQRTVQDILADATRAHDVAVSSRKKLKQVKSGCEKHNGSSRTCGARWLLWTGLR
jgi:hypothetical protein